MPIVDDLSQGVLTIIILLSIGLALYAKKQGKSIVEILNGFLDSFRGEKVDEARGSTGL